MDDFIHGEKNIFDVQKLLNSVYDIWHTRRHGRSTITARQQARLEEIVSFAREHSSFYRELYRDKRDVRNLPPVTKQVLMANFDSWVTDPEVNRGGVEAFVADEHLVGSLYLGRYAIFTTSGVTGKRGIFVHDSDALAIYTALGIVRNSPGALEPEHIKGMLRSGGRVAVVVATGGHFAGAAAAELARRRSHRIQSFSVLMPLPELVRALNDFQPAVLFGYPTALLLLAYEQAEGRLRIRPVEAVTGGEWLAPAARRQIGQAFKCRVRDLYAASEFPGIAFDCGHGWLHVNADWVILEPVDEAYRPVQPGEASRTVLLTNLANRLQPIIRYDLGDSITLNPDPCPCGSPLPAIRVEGRRDEIMFLRAQGGEKIPLLPMALATVIEETPGVARFQAIQTAPAAIRIRLEVISGRDEKQVWEAVAHRLQDYLSVQGLPSIAIERAGEPPARDPISGKFRQVWTEL